MATVLDPQVKTLPSSHKFFLDSAAKTTSFSPALNGKTLSGVWLKLLSPHIYAFKCTNMTATIFQNNLEARTELVGNVLGGYWWRSRLMKMSELWPCSTCVSAFSRTCVIWAITCVRIDYLPSDKVEGSGQEIPYCSILLPRCEGVSVNHLYISYKYSWKIIYMCRHMYIFTLCMVKIHLRYIWKIWCLPC